MKLVRTTKNKFLTVTYYPFIVTDTDIDFAWQVWYNVSMECRYLSLALSKRYDCIAWITSDSKLAGVA